MTCSDHATRLAPTPARLSASPAQALAALLSRALAKVGAFITARRHRRAIAELAECDEYMLHDIGLSRSAVEGALCVSFAEDPSILLERPSPSYAVREIKRAEELPWVRLHG